MQSKASKFLESVRNYDIAAVLDSNGNQIKLEKSYTGSGPKSVEAVVGNVYNKILNTNNIKAKYLVTRTNSSKVWLDMIDDAGNPIPRWSGDLGFELKMSDFIRDFKQSK